MFGNATLVVVCLNLARVVAILTCLLYQKVGKSMLVRMVYDFLDAIQEETVFYRGDIGSQIRMPEWAKLLVDSVVGCDGVVSERVRAPCGFIRKDDVVWIKEPFKLATVLLAVRVGSRVDNHRFFVIVQHFTTLPSGVWSCRRGAIEVVDVASISTACSFVVHGDRVYV